MEPEVIEEPGTDLITEVKSILGVATSDQYLRVSTLRGLISDMTKAITADAQPAIDSAKATYELLRDERDAKVGPFAAEYKRLGMLLGAFNAEQERIKKRKELEIEAANKAAAEKERGELAALAGEMGDKTLRRQILKAPLEVAPVVVTSGTPKIDGMSYPEIWHYEVENLLALVKGVASGKVPINALADPDKPFRSGYLHKQATALKKMLNYPGVRVWSTKDPRQS